MSISKIYISLLIFYYIGIKNGLVLCKHSSKGAIIIATGGPAHIPIPIPVPIPITVPNHHHLSSYNHQHYNNNNSHQSKIIVLPIFTHDHRKMYETDGNKISHEHPQLGIFYPTSSYFNSWI